MIPWSEIVRPNEREDQLFVERALEIIGVQSQDFALLFPDAEYYAELCDRCTQEQVEQQGGRLRGMLRDEKESNTIKRINPQGLSSDEIQDGRTPRSLLLDAYLAALGRLGLTERALESIVFSGAR